MKIDKTKFPGTEKDTSLFAATFRYHEFLYMNKRGRNPVPLSSTEASKERDRDRENRARFLPPSHRSPRAHHSLHQSSNIFIALACSPDGPLEKFQGTSAENAECKCSLYGTKFAWCLVTRPLFFSVCARTLTAR